MSDLIAELQRRIGLLEGSISDSKREYEDTLSGQQRVIIHHQGEVSSLKNTIQDRDDEGSKVYDEITFTKKQIEDKESEIFTLSREIDYVRKGNEDLRRDIDYV